MNEGAIEQASERVYMLPNDISKRSFAFTPAEQTSYKHLRGAEGTLLAPA